MFGVNRYGSQPECLLEEPVPGWLQVSQCAARPISAAHIPLLLGYLAIGAQSRIGRGFEVSSRGRSWHQPAVFARIQSTARLDCVVLQMSACCS